MDEYLRVCDLTWSGRKLSSSEVQELESSLTLDPNQNDVRVKLLGYYFGKDIGRPRYLELRCKHIFWLIEHSPAHEVLSHPEAEPHFHPDPNGFYRRGSELWAKQVEIHSKNGEVLNNAANYHFHHDRQRSISLLEAAVAIEPDNSKFKDRLALACELAARNNKSEKLLQKAMALREELVDAEPTRKHKHVADVATIAYKLKQYEKCGMLAEQILSSPNAKLKHQNEWHVAHQLIGLVQLTNNHKTEACRSLLRSVDIETTPVLSSFGPKFQLASELLKDGERRAVLEYLESCSKFWQSGQKDLALWWLQIKLGKTPKLEKTGALELFLPRWLNIPAARFMSLMRARTKP